MGKSVPYKTLLFDELFLISFFIDRFMGLLRLTTQTATSPPVWEVDRAQLAAEPVSLEVAGMPPGGSPSHSQGRFKELP